MWDVARVQSAQRTLGIRTVPPRAAPALVRMGQPDPDRSCGWWASWPKGSRIARSPSGCSSHGAPSPPTSSTCSKSSATPTESSSPPTRPAEPSAIEATPTAPTAPGAAPANPRRRAPAPPPRLTRPAGGSIASSRIVITTTRSCQPDRAPHIGHLTDVGNVALPRRRRDATGHIGHLTDAPRTRLGSPWHGDEEDAMGLGVRRSSRSLPSSHSIDGLRRRCDRADRCGSDGCRHGHDRLGDDANGAGHNGVVVSDETVLLRTVVEEAVGASWPSRPER